MWELLSKYTFTAAGSTIKFIGGPLAGFGTGLSVWETSLCTAAGMMFTVTLLSLIGDTARKKIVSLFSKKNKKTFTKRNRSIVKIWKKYGMLGVAFLTPVILTPPLGTIIAIYFGEQKKRIVLYMFVSSIFWGFVTTWVVYQLGPNIIGQFIG